MDLIFSLINSLWPVFVLPLGFALGFGLLIKIMREVRNAFSSGETEITSGLSSRYHYISADDSGDEDDGDDTEDTEEESHPTPVRGHCPRCGAPRKTNPCDYCGSYTS